MTFVFVLFLCIHTSYLPIPPINGIAIKIGAINTSVAHNNVIDTSHYAPEILVFYALTLASFFGSIVCLLLIKFKYVYDANNFTWPSSQWLIIDAVAIIFISVAIFTQNISSPINFGVDNANWTNIGIIFSYRISQNVVEFSYTPTGITYLTFLSLEIAAMFGYWLYFTFKIIRHKYII